MARYAGYRFRELLIVQSVQATDPELLARLRREACNGVLAEVTVEQRLSPDGISNVLCDFAFVEASPATVAV